MIEREGALKDKKIRRIIGQYRQVVGDLNEMFLEMSKRTEFEPWRIDGVGSCAIPTHIADAGIEGIAKEELLTLRKIRGSLDNNERAEGRRIVCAYHRKGHGCALGDLKSPVCIAHVDNPGEVVDTFGINPKGLKFYIRDTLKKILLGDWEDNEQFVGEALETIKIWRSWILEMPEIDDRERVSFE